MIKKNKTETGKIIKKRFDFFSFFTAFLAVLVGIELVVGVTGINTVKTMMEDSPTLNVEELVSQESTRIFDKNGTQIADVGETLRENITYDEMPEALVDAFLSIEDSRYFKHNGFDIARFAAAALSNVRSGSTGQGGSTFTMQLIKLTYFFTDEDTTSRARDVEYKVQQIGMAIQLEKQATKKQIFELYVNKMNFGGEGNIRGVEKASQYYFNKHTSELNLSECALLAGIINSPYWYDPTKFLDYATIRRNQVLDMMLRHGYITENEYDLAKSVQVENLIYDHSQDDSEDSTQYRKYQAYIDTVLSDAEEITGQDPLTIAMDIYTAMDPDVQALSDSICAGEVDSVYVPNDLAEIGFITLNNQTGEIVAVGGGRNYGDGGSMLFNHATQSYQQPGSVVKPFLDYALAFEYLGWATCHTVTDQPVATGNWVYSNATGYYGGQVSLDYALQMSLNTPAIQAMQDIIDKVGLSTVEDYVSKLQFARYSTENFDIGWAIGGNNFYASPEEIAAAHAMVANNGNYIKPHTIVSITYRDGFQDPITVSELEDYKPVKCLSEGAAFMTMTEMYKVVYAPFFNYAGILQKWYPTYGKTGTSDWGTYGLQYGIPEGAMKDKWMVGETTEYTIATWMGFDKAVDGGGCYFTSYTDSYNTNGNIISCLLDQLYADGHTPPELTEPDDVTTITTIKGVFPYVTPISGMDEQYITSGYVKKEFATLGSPESASDVKEISSFSAEMADDNNTIRFNWADYPDPDKLQVADSTMKLVCKDAAGNVLKTASGTRVFDYSWVYGAIAYKATVKQNGEVIGSISTDTANAEQSIDGLAPETETQVCGYYGYDKLDKNSNEICVSFTTPEARITVPDSYSTKDEVIAWAAQYGITISSTEYSTDQSSGIEIKYKGNNICGTTYKRSELPSSIKLTVYGTNGVD